MSMSIGTVLRSLALHARGCWQGLRGGPYQAQVGDDEDPSLTIVPLGVLRSGECSSRLEDLGARESPHARTCTVGDRRPTKQVHIHIPTPSVSPCFGLGIQWNMTIFKRTHAAAAAAAAAPNYRKRPEGGRPSSTELMESIWNSPFRSFSALAEPEVRRDGGAAAIAALAMSLPAASGLRPSYPRYRPPESTNLASLSIQNSGAGQPFKRSDRPWPTQKLTQLCPVQGGCLGRAQLEVRHY